MEIMSKSILKQDLEEYKSYYFRVSNKRILFYNQIDEGDKKELKDCACNFLCALSIFEDKVPKEVIKKEFEDFRRARNLAKEILRSFL